METSNGGHPIGRVRDQGRVRVVSRRTLWDDSPNRRARLDEGRGGSVPLSEDEERILQDIAQQFYVDDPEFAGRVGETTLYTHTLRRMKWSGLGFVLAVVFLVASLSTGYLLAFGGFLAMLACALYFERNLRKLGKVGLDEVSRSMKATHLRDALDGARSRVRDRFRQADE